MTFLESIVPLNTKSYCRPTWRQKMSFSSWCCLIRGIHLSYYKSWARKVDASPPNFSLLILDRVSCISLKRELPLTLEYNLAIILLGDNRTDDSIIALRSIYCHLRVRIYRPHSSIMIWGQICLFNPLKLPSSTHFWTTMKYS